MDIRICQRKILGIDKRICDPDGAEGPAKQVTEQKPGKRTSGPDDHGLNNEDRPHCELRKAKRLHDRDVPRLLMRDGRDDVVGPKACDEQNCAHDRVHNNVANDKRRKQIFVRLLP